MELKNVLETILRSLPQWETTGLNEAQTRQAIVLRMLLIAGYDILDPLSVFPEKNSGGGSGGYIPDFTILLDGKPRFIIEAKALSKKITDNDRTQAVNYVNSIGLRWAILTNGRTWLFLDNQLSGAAYKKLALSIEIQQKDSIQQLIDLLNPELWQMANAEEKIANLIQLIHLKVRILKIHAEGYASNEKGLNLLIKQHLSETDQAFVTQHYVQLKTWFLDVTNSVMTEIPSSTDITQKLADHIKAYTANRRLHNPAVIELGEIIIETTWRSIYVGTVETCLALGKEVKQALESSHPSYKQHPDWYHVLSNGKVLLVSLSSEEIRKRLIEPLKMLPIPARSVKILYKQHTYFFP